ncbi:unnamed protein product [Linum trigynum]|uniref:FAR1 domain-containing protein n=1 Tax=Linum trigynum TaxID=586398 RepID=A0AAV2EPI3_9ROSI
MEEEEHPRNSAIEDDLESLEETRETVNGIQNGETTGMEDVILDPPKIGQIFNDFEEAYNFYNDYARAWGFSVRRSKKVQNSKGEVTTGAFVCSCEGHRAPNKGEKKRDSPMETRFGCKAKMRVAFNKNDSKWIVDIFKEDHNHMPINRQCTHHLRSQRGLTEADKADFRFKKNAGMKPSQIIKLAVHNAGGHDKVGYTVKDGMNFSTRDSQ